MKTSELARLLLSRKATLSTSESCSGGLIAHTLTNIPGSSAWFNGGVIAYANAAKTGLLQVPAPLIDRCGAVSGPVARAMAEGVRARLKTTFGVSTTGIAGPGGGTKDKPVGLVFIACATPGRTLIRKCFFTGSRLSIKRQTTTAAIALLVTALSKRTL